MYSVPEYEIQICNVQLFAQKSANNCTNRPFCATVAPKMRKNVHGYPPSKSRLLFFEENRARNNKKPRFYVIFALEKSKKYQSAGNKKGCPGTSFEITYAPYLRYLSYLASISASPSNSRLSLMNFARSEAICSVTSERFA